MPSSIAVPATPEVARHLPGPRSAAGLQRWSSAERASVAFTDGARPAWGCLYAILPTSAALYAFVYVAVPEGFWLTAAEYGVAAVTLALFACWVAANRIVRARIEKLADAPPLRVVSLFLPESAASPADGPDAPLLRTCHPGDPPGPAVPRLAEAPRP